ncbi:MAG TPA: dTDP-4-dehydrorhamnose reductase [Puia sp.]
MKIAVIGANGQLGSDLMESFSGRHETLPLNHTDIEIIDIDNVKTVLTAFKPDVVLNTSAYHNVPLCEQHAETAFAINGRGALNLAKVCTDINAKLVHYSTDYVFDGNKKLPYTETDYCSPLNVYGVTKLTGENFVLSYASRPYVIRVSGIYGKVPCRAKGGNFVTTMIKLAKEKPEVKVVNDEILTPTSTSAIAGNTLRLIESEAYGLYHMTCEGQCSWYEFARAIWDILRLETPLLPASVKDFPITVKRPFYSVLENKNLNAIALNEMPDWKEALLKFLK